MKKNSPGADEAVLLFRGRGKMYFDRAAAGRMLGAGLEQYKGRDALVLGIPRGGVPVAAEVARALDADLDVIVAASWALPDNPSWLLVP